MTMNSDLDRNLLLSGDGAVNAFLGESMLSVKLL